MRNDLDISQNVLKLKLMNILRGLGYTANQIEKALPVALDIVSKANKEHVDPALALAYAHAESTMGTRSDNVFQMTPIALKDVESDEPSIDAGIKFIKKISDTAQASGIEDEDGILASYYAGISNIKENGLDFTPNPENNTITAREYANRMKNTIKAFDLGELNEIFNSDINSRNAGASESDFKKKFDELYASNLENVSMGLSEPQAQDSMNKGFGAIGLDSKANSEKVPDITSDFSMFQKTGTSPLIEEANKKKELKDELESDIIKNVNTDMTTEAVDTTYEGTGGNGEQAAFLKYYARGLLFGHKIGYDVSDDVLTPQMKQTAEFLGSMTNAIGTTVLSAGMADVLMGSAFVSRTLGVSKAVNASMASALKLNKLAQFGDAAVEAGVRATIMGGMYNTMQQLGRPEDKKLTGKEMLANTAMFVTGDVGRAFSTLALENAALHGATKQLINFSVDTVASALGGYAVHGNKDQAVTDVIGPQSIAFGIADQIMYAISKGKINVNRFNEDDLNNLGQSLKAFSKDNTYQNAKGVVNSLDSFIKKAINGDESSVTDYFKKLTLERKQDFIDTYKVGVEEKAIPDYVEVDIKKTRVVQDPNTKEYKQIKFNSEADAETFDLLNFVPKDVDENTLKTVETDIAKKVAEEEINNKTNNKVDLDETLGLSPKKEEVQKEHVVEPEVPKKIQKQIDEKKKELLNKENWKVSEDEKVILHTENKPSEGYSLNTTKLNASDEVLKELNDIANIVDQTMAKTNFDEIDVKASNVAKTVKELGAFKDEMKELAALTQNMPEKVVALRKMIVDTGEQVYNKAKALQDLIDQGANISDLDLAQFKYLVDLQTDLTSSLKSVYRSTAQTLSSGRIVAEGGTFKHIIELTPDAYARSPEAVAKVNQAMNDIDLDQLKHLIKSISAEGKYNTSKVNKTIKLKPLTTRILEAFVDYRRANLLTSFNTHATNIMSQAFNSITEGVVNYMAAGINGAKRWIGKGTPGEMTFAEANARVIGNFEGMVDAWKRPIVSFNDIYGIQHGKAGLSAMDRLYMRITKPTEYLGVTSKINLGGSKLDAENIAKGFTSEAFPELNNTKVGQTIAKVMDFYGSQQKLFSYSFLEAGDAPFALGAYKAEVNGQIARLYKNNSISKVEMEKLQKEVLAYRTAEMLTPALKEKYAHIEDINKRQAMIQNELKERTGVDLNKLDDLELVKRIDKEALTHSKDMTWKTQLDSKLLRDFEQFINRNPIMRIFLPFTHTPMKILEKWAYSSGLNKKFYNDLKGVNGPDAKTNAQARFLVSSLLYGTAAFLFYEGKLTPTARNSKERERMRAAGIPENSLKIGDIWVDFNRLDPAPSLYFSTMANALRVMEEDHSDDTALGVAGEVIGNTCHNLLNKTWFIALKDTMEALTGVGTNGFIRSMVDSVKPMRGWQSYGYKITHDYLKDTHAKLLEDKPRLDVYGDPIPIPAEIMGLKMYEVSDSPIRREVLKLGLSLPDVGHTLRGVKLNEEQRYMIKQELGRMKASEVLSKLIKKSSYQKLPVESKMRIIKKTWDNLKDKASLVVLRSAEFKQAMKEATQEKQDNKKKLTTDAEVIFNKYISGPQHNKKSDSIDKGLDTLLQYNK